uniref:Uncharacterized protein n=1 Tax=Calidris pygmaea TaxID=425635 RepID=A0A8C3J3D4_9CHAR
REHQQSGAHSQGGSTGMALPPPLSRERARLPPTYPGGCVLQVCGVHRCAQRHRAGLCLLQVLLHLHQAQLQVHPPALLPFALFFDLLQPLLQALVCEGKGKLVPDRNLGTPNLFYLAETSVPGKPASLYIESDIPTKYRFFHSHNVNFASTSSSHL